MMDDYIKKSEEIQELLDSLLEGQESSEIEFKSAKGGFPGSFWETYSSFANTGGGMIIFGVREKHGFFYLDPLSDETVKLFKKQFFDLQRDREKVNIQLLSDRDVVPIEVDGGFLLAFFIPRATREQRPVHVGLNPMTGTYRRDYEGDYVCDPMTVSQMFAEKESSQVKTESRILANYSWDDIDMESFRQYRTIFTNLTPAHPWTVLSNQELLTKLGGYRVDRRSGEKGFTLAGILMFGKTEAITDVECLPDFMVDYREIPADTSVTRWTDRLYPDGTWEANLFQFYRRTLLKLFAFLPKPFILKGDERQDETPTHEAVREALINLCVHSTYGKSPRLVVEKRPTCIVMSNPGTLLISKEQYFEGGHSECRNPSLQRMFGLIGRSDKAGSGVDKILKGWTFAKWRRPSLNEKSRPDMVELYLPLESLYSDETISRLKTIYGNVITEIEPNRLTILLTALKESNVTNLTLQNVMELHPVDITKLLKEMCRENLLVHSGVGRGSTYQINEAYVVSSDVVSSDVVSSDVVSSDVASPDVVSSDSTLNTKKLILDCCKYKYLSAKDISYKIGRELSYVRKVITRLIAEGYLSTEYEQIRHPAQRYKTIKKSN